jgi:aryl-alcohol dehydrogenase-like predicted oxidoreductase
MSMRYKLLGHTGLRVSELCLGAMTLDDRSRIELGFPTTSAAAASPTATRAR